MLFVSLIFDFNRKNNSLLKSSIQADSTRRKRKKLRIGHKKLRIQAAHRIQEGIRTFYLLLVKLFNFKSKEGILEKVTTTNLFCRVLNTKKKIKHFKIEGFMTKEGPLQALIFFSP